MLTPASDHTAMRPSPGNSGTTGPKRSNTNELIRVTVRIQNTEDAILVPCDQTDQTVEWLISEATSRLEEILEAPVSSVFFARGGFLVVSFHRLLATSGGDQTAHDNRWHRTLKAR